MIDTSKYEGHRQPWVFTAGVSYPMSKADIALRHDAPLLWGFDGKNTGWMKGHEELAMKELNWGEEE